LVISIDIVGVCDHQPRRRRPALSRAAIPDINAVEGSLEGTMWTPITRRQHSREHQRYGSDLTDAERAIIAPLLPPAGKTGRPRRWPMRDIIDAILDVLRSRLPVAHGTGELCPVLDGLPLVHPATE
jgi:hypothetical protein